MSNIFLSHSKVDVTHAERLGLALRAAHHNVWFDEWEIGVGDSIVERINEGLLGAPYLILCYSSAGLSPWVDREWMSTLARQMSTRGVKILPALLTGGIPPAILADIKFADLVQDWDKGVADLLRSIR